MRRVLLLLAFLVVLPCVFAVCGNCILEPGEECEIFGDDDWCDVNPDYPCPGLCDYANCVCMKEVKNTLQDLYSGHNLLFSKAMDLSHISKDVSMQDELKVIQYGLRQAYVNPPNNNACQVVPSLFMMPANYHPYGKENEIDQLNHYFLFKLRDSVLRQQLNVSDVQYNESGLIQNIANTALASTNFSLSGSAKCCAYNQLIEPSVIGFRISNRTCDVVPLCGNNIVEFPEQCDDGNLVSGDGCSENCTIEICGDGIIQPGAPRFEQCDPPVLGICDINCHFIGVVCGDGTVQPPEQCDPGAPLPKPDPTCPASVNGSHICSNICSCEECGNGIIDVHELCDDGGKCSDNNASCTTLNKAACGVPATATCIIYNGDGCNVTCQPEWCGDNIIQAGPPRFEECEPPFSPGCDGACHDPWCGDGTIQAWEQCDPPGPDLTCASGICDVGCECRACGNGILEDAEECETGIACAPGFSCTAVCECHKCGDGRIEPGEQCGEPGLVCPAGETCTNCRCYPPGGGPGGGGSNKFVPAPAACCKAFDFVGDKQIAEYYCCGGQDLTSPTGVHINCCAEPELPQCIPYCKLMTCISPYKLDQRIGRCVFSEVLPPKAETAQKTQPVVAKPQPAPVPPVECAPGYELKDGKCVQKSPFEPKQFIIPLTPMSIATVVLALLVVALLVYMIVARRRVVPVAAQVPPVQLPVETPKVDEYTKVESELQDLEKSYDELEKMIKSYKSKKV